ncbi:MAG: DegT/DnrJ/EryC1/StrS family aminotransferase [Deltaproteobacteria bacterium]|nr:DegT/DnrJ/EryC1/StrS family aminotransferase [Deltaproteobacteria bacterium]
MDPHELKRCLLEDCELRNGRLYYRHVDHLTSHESPLFHLCRHSETGAPLSEVGRVAAILPVHQMGIPCDIGHIVNIGKEFELPVIEDAACALGSEISRDQGSTWERIGKPHGDIACFSFHPRKIITTGDGGMITTNSGRLDHRLRLLRHHGMNIPDIKRHFSEKVIFEEYLTTGFNYRMTDIQAAVGIEQLKKLEGILEKRRRTAQQYGQLLKDIPCLEPLEPGPFARPNWQSYPVRIHGESRLRQMELMQFLLDRGISTRRGIMNAHQEPAYLQAGWSLPISEESRDSVILLPLYPEIDDSVPAHIDAVLREALVSNVPRGLRT